MASIRPSASVAARSLTLAATALAVVAFVVAYDPMAVSPAQAQPGPQGPVPVTVVTLKSQPLTIKRELPGRTAAFLIAEVRPQVSGIVKERLFTEGGQVKAGQPLYQLDDATYRANLNSAKAALTRAQANLQATRLTANRTAELARIDAVSKQENENATAARNLAQADVAAAQAAVQAAQVPLGHARLTAPISGRIGKSAVTQGALVTANQAVPLATIQQLDPIYVDLTQSSAELLQLRRALASGELKSTLDYPVTVMLEDGSAYEHTGKLTFADVTVDQATGSFLLRLQVPNPDRILLPGMYVRAVVGAGQLGNAVLVPQRAVSRDPKGGTSAMVVTAENTIEARPIKVERTVGDQWLVESGLKAGERVVVEGLQKIHPGASVQPAEADNTPASAPPAGNAASAASR